MTYCPVGDLSTSPQSRTLDQIADHVLDATEETFILFSQDLPQNDLGIWDPTASEVELEVAGRDFIIKQSPSLLKSTRQTGTTGAVMWKVTPLVADWLASTQSILWTQGVLTASSNVVELGCGIAGIVGLAVAPKISTYILSDQNYVMKLLKENLSANADSSAAGDGRKQMDTLHKSNVRPETLSLDWEADSVLNLKQFLSNEASIDMIVLCDCIYNLHLIEPLVENCLDICLMNSSRTTVVLIAQQLRTDIVFEQWLSALMKYFTVWRIKDEHLPSTLGSSSGYAVHTAMLRQAQYGISS